MKKLFFWIFLTYVQAKKSSGRMLTRVTNVNKTTYKKIENGRHAKFECPNLRPTLKIWHGETDKARDHKDGKNQSSIEHKLT